MILSNTISNFFHWAICLGLHVFHILNVQGLFSRVLLYNATKYSSLLELWSELWECFDSAFSFFVSFVDDTNRVGVKSLVLPF